MERIKQALELARQERQKNSAGGRKVSTLLNEKSGVAEENIKYTETRHVTINTSELRKRRIMVEQQNNVADAYRILRTQILQRMREKEWNTLAVTSPKNAEGKTLTAINLAISLAREVDYTVLLVDANLRSPSVHKKLGFYSEYGLSDYLQSDVPLSELLIHPEGIPRFVVLPAGHAIENSSEMLSSPKMSRLVEELKHRYPSRIVIFDLPSILNSSDALAFSPLIDTTLVVIEDGVTQRQELRQAFEMLNGVDVIGTVLNNAYSTERDYGDVHLKDGLVSKFINFITKKPASKYSDAH